MAVDFDTKDVNFNEPAAVKKAGEYLETTVEMIADRLALSPAVTDAAALAQAVIDRKDIADHDKRIVAYFAPMKAAAHSLHAMLCARERELRDPLRALDESKAAAIRAYHDAELVERRRREREAAEAAQREREAEAATEAAALERVGDHGLAAAIVADAIAQPAPVVALPDPTAGIVTFTRRWHWKYAGGPMDISHTPPDVLRRALDRVPIDFHMIDEKKIGAYVRSMKGSGAIDGIDIYYTDEPNR